MKRIVTIMTAAGLLGTLTGCTVGPDYHRGLPDTARLARLPSSTPVAAVANGAVGGTASIQPGVPVTRWWTDFDDAALNRFVARAWRANYDLRATEANYAAALAGVAEARSAGLPELSAGASIARARTSTLTSNTGVPEVGSPTLASAGIDWELDLFGRIRRGIEAARADAQASADARDDLRRLVVAQVAMAYLDLREAQQQYAEVARERELARRIATLVAARERVGRVGRLDVVRAAGQAADVEARLEPLAARVRARRDRLATLTALPLDAPEILALERPVPVRAPGFVLADDPAGLIGRRPDVREAERRLAAQTARIGVASADLYPRISLSGLLGLGALSPNQLYETASKLWSGGAALSWQFLDGGALRARVRAAGARADAALADYDRAVTAALEEADVALDAYLHEAARNGALREADRDAAQAEALADAQYRAGRIDLLDWLDVQRTRLQSAQAYTESSYTLSRRVVDVYTAFAGGLDVPPDANDGEVAKR
ncbi:efflux transporter outer membrane subunit [Burkholderia plantarii]|uniref:efflux transporter outer membrane subunit n=1 Tax=Burkholderia plantarii TaxID=41899 RepID=UPI0006D8AD33|nr:efflux transporter outer membrane subunit [Burkholderia plantarii]ALK32913.1 outer membrane protein [Burkholderia plantarii]WLE61984.1 efflux transporter outer membrane subunit [Burkholderia plantarii]GLZ20335.1 RND transporter [Burkholderia plantarii]